MAVGHKSLLFYAVLYFSCFVVRSEVPTDNGKNMDTSTNPAEENVKTSTQSEVYTRSVPGMNERTTSCFVCDHGTKCGFQIYNEHTRRPNVPFIKYCDCPENTPHCVKAGENVNMKFFYYRCKDTLEAEDETMPTDFTNTEEIVPDIFDLEDLKVMSSRVQITLDFYAELSALSTRTLMGASGKMEQTADDLAVEYALGTRTVKSTRVKTDMSAGDVATVTGFGTNKIPSTSGKMEQTADDLGVESALDTNTVKSTRVIRNLATGDLAAETGFGTSIVPNAGGNLHNTEQSSGQTQDILNPEFIADSSWNSDGREEL